MLVNSYLMLLMTIACQLELMFECSKMCENTKAVQTPS